MRKTQLSPFWEHILFAAHVRVYTLRVLLLVSILSFPAFLLPAPLSSGQIGWVIGAGLGIIHQIITGLVLRPSLLLAALDMFLLLLELVLMIVALVSSIPYQANPLAWRGAGVVSILGLSFSFTLRLAAIRRGQGLGLLGGCRPTTLPYNSKSIFLNRSFHRPLVRGESMLIRIIRAFCISGIVLMIPAFAFYAIILVPSAQQTYLRLQVGTTSSASNLALAGGSFLSNPTFWIAPFSISGEPSQFAVNWTITFSSYPQATQIPATTCVETNVTIPQFFTTCDSLSMFNAWGTLMYLEISLPLELSGITVTLMPWSDIVGYTTPLMGTIGPDGSFTMAHFAIQSLPVLVLRGSHLLGQITWTQEVGQSTPMGSLYTPLVYNLQADTTTTPTINSSNSAALHLFNPPFPGLSTGGYYHQMNDKSTISGFSNLGGFWAFVDGTFALLFGANVIYFAFGHRPLSALGVLHIFQRKTLTQNWNEDFPALHTEGGLPGTASAGIVTFIRERLVDVGKAPNPTATVEDLQEVEGQNTNEDTYEVQSLEPAAGGSTDSVVLKPLRGRDFFRYSSAV